ncbi:ankyrin repeat domain-containing protein 18B-like [Tetranychus urticae]|uniref:Uncharacterized protein n=1 Tax=Tetranychus urticae TaxID=32264 RepID=T1JS04_TETUR|nr:ankyrin repeat domain-containing protein 18B-like [Tetranychus urticae]XP_025017458.1 ankyrin repeat domain-containing protein 18B-like [Tetranychus urticae]
MVSITDSLNSTGQWTSLAYPSEFITINQKVAKNNSYYGNGTATVKGKLSNKLNSIDASNNTALFDSIRNQRYRQCLLLIQSGQDVNGRNELGETPLIHLVKSLNRKEHKKMRAKFAKLLLDFGANPNLQDSRGQTALIHATIKGQDDLVQSLLSHDETDITIQDKEGNTGLMYGAKGGQLSVVECYIDHFIKRELDPNLLRQRNNYGKNALEIAKEESRSEIVSMLTNYLTQFNSIYSKDLERWTSIRPKMSKAKSLDSISIDSDVTYVTSEQRINHHNSQHHLCQSYDQNEQDNPNSTESLSSSHKQQQCSLSRRHCINEGNIYRDSEPLVNDNLNNFNNTNVNFESALRRKIENLKSINRPTDYYEEIWEQETMSWFNGDNHETGQTNGQQRSSNKSSNKSSPNSLSRGPVKCEPNSNNNQQMDSEALKLPPIGNNRLIDYKTWCDMGMAAKNKTK